MTEGVQSELSALIGVYGAIDQRVVADPSLEPAVAALLCPYRYGASGWYRPFAAWVAEQGHQSEPFPPLTSALAELANVPPRGRSIARRLLALATLSRVYDQFADEPALKRDVVQSMVGPGIAPNTAKSAKLLDLLGDAELFPNIAAWDAMLAEALAQGLINEAAASQSQPPCAAQVIYMPGNPDPICTLETSFCTPIAQLPMTRAEMFLDPRNWPGCSPLWCSMTQISGATPPAQRYLEVISINCNGGGMKLRTCLDFVLLQLPDGSGAMVEYQRSSDQSGGGDGLVTVDEGSLEVRQVGQDVCIRTTKRIQFGYNFSAGALAMISCALGYASVGEDLIYTCAFGAGNDPKYPYQGQGIPKVRIKGTGNIVGDGIAAVQGCIAKCAGAYQCAYDKLQAGKYTPSDAAEDFARAGGRAIRDMATVATLGAQAARLAQESRASDDAEVPT